ncbi:MAG: YesL family protein [Lachnospiraceae bacterium]
MKNLFDLDSPLMRFLSRIADLILLNLIYLICCIPIVTIGAASTALYSVTLKMVKDEDSYIFRSFFTAFKENFKAATLPWLLMLVFGAALVFDFMLTRSVSGTLIYIVQIFLGIITFLFISMSIYLFPYIARFENTMFNNLKNALLMSIIHLPYTILLIVLAALPVVVLMINISIGLFIWIFLGLSLVSFVSSFLFRKIFKKYEGEDPVEDTAGAK